MKITKKVILRAFFALEIVVCTFFYIFGAQGMRTVYAIRQQNRELGQQVALARDNVKQLELQIAVWQTSDFYKEKKAREQLQMARTDDIVYYIDQEKV